MTFGEGRVHGGMDRIIKGRHFSLILKREVAMTVRVEDSVVYWLVRRLEDGDFFYRSLLINGMTEFFP